MTFRISGDFHDTHLYIRHALLVPRVMICTWTLDWNVSSKWVCYVVASVVRNDNSQWVLMSKSRHNCSTQCAHDLYFYILSKAVFSCFCDISPYSYTGQQRGIYVVWIMLHISQQIRNIIHDSLRVTLTFLKTSGGLARQSWHDAISELSVTHFEIELFLWSESKVPINMEITNPKKACRAWIKRFHFAIKNCGSQVFMLIQVDIWTLCDHTCTLFDTCATFPFDIQ